MANVTVTILRSGRCDSWGRPYVVGDSYSVEFNEARALWQTGFASVSDETVFKDYAPYKSVVGLVKNVGFSGFRRCMVASLVANSTAARTNGLVTITAPSHGITTGATYQGYLFFYPGSPSLAAGWYDSIYSIANANTLAFTAPGPDFASESVNGAAAYTTQTVVPGSVIIKGGFFDDFSRARVSFGSGGGITAASKSVRPIVNNTQLSAISATTSPFVVREIELVPVSSTSLGAMLIGGVQSGIIPATVDKSLDVEVTLAVTVSAAGDFIFLFPPPGAVLLAG